MYVLNRSPMQKQPVYVVNQEEEEEEGESERSVPLTCS